MKSKGIQAKVDLLERWILELQRKKCEFVRCTSRGEDFTQFKYWDMQQDLLYEFLEMLEEKEDAMECVKKQET